MKRWAFVAGGAGLVVIIFAAALFSGALPAVLNKVTTTTCRQCPPQEKVVDVVMPVIGTSGNLTNPNRQVNMTLGENTTFEVDIFTTAGLGFAMSFRSVLVSAGAGGTAGQGGSDIAAAFQPGTLHVAADAKGITEMTIEVPPGATRGTYDAVVSAANVSNSTEVWGLYFEIVVG